MFQTMNSIWGWKIEVGLQITVPNDPKNASKVRCTIYYFYCECYDTNNTMLLVADETYHYPGYYG